MPAVATDTPTLPSHQVQPMRWKQFLGLHASIWKARIKEYLFFDSAIFRTSAGFFGYLTARLLIATGRVRKGFDLLCKLHRADFLSVSNKAAESLVKEASEAIAHGQDHPLRSVYESHIDSHVPGPNQLRFFENPNRLLGSTALVLKSAGPREKGVLLFQYSYTFPLIARRFNLPKIAERYYIVLEPDWSGYCDPNILSYCRYPFPVFVQAFEPRDAEFIRTTNSNLVSVPVSANWWIDHRLFYPIVRAKKDIDVVMVAGWGRYKRHAAFFAALRKLRRANHRLRVLLLGYPLDVNRDAILQLANSYGIADQIETEEWVPYEKMNEQINRAKTCMIWSRREGVNRAIIEAMLASVPCIVRDGFNYGYHYPYINSQTGCYSTESNLPQTLIRMVKEYESYSPRDWVTSHMTCQHATRILSDAIAQSAATRNEPWSGGVVAKVNKLHNVEYWDADDAKRFEPDYEYLRTMIRQ